MDTNTNMNEKKGNNYLKKVLLALLVFIIVYGTGRILLRHLVLVEDMDVENEVKETERLIKTETDYLNALDLRQDFSACL